MTFFLSDNIYFPYRSSTGEDRTLMLYHQVNEDALLFILAVEIFALLVLLILSILAILVLKRVNYHKNFLVKISSFVSLTGVSLCVYLLVGTINFSQSLVSCDNFVFGKSPGCYIPSSQK
jgi:amino acid transporter